MRRKLKMSEERVLRQLCDGVIPAAVRKLAEEFAGRNAMISSAPLLPDQLVTVVMIAERAESYVVIPVEAKKATKKRPKKPVKKPSYEVADDPIAVAKRRASELVGAT